MRSASIGLPAASPSKRSDRGLQRGGFTLVEVLVALSLLLTFAMVLEPLLFQSRHILMRGNGDVAAQSLLRSLLAEPFDRSKPEIGTRAGDSDNLRWSIDVEPYVDDEAPPDAALQKLTTERPINWALFLVRASVSWGAGQTVTAQTLRLGQTK